MRQSLLSLTALAGLLVAGSAASAVAAPLRVETAPVATPLVQPVDYYGHDDWRARAWRHREWERRRHEEWLRHHRYHHGW